MEMISEKFTTKLTVEKLPDGSLIKFSTGNTVTIDQSKGELKLYNKNHGLQLSICIKDNDLVLDICTSKVNINAVDELNLTSKKINISASEQLNLKTPGNLIMEIGKDSLCEIAGTNKSIAQIQKITASLGNVEIKANDVVRLDGEKVLLNCD